MQVDLKASSIRFLYPFLFEPGEFKALVGAVKEATWPDGRHKRKVWQRMSFDADDLLPHVADFLNPPDNAEADATAYLWTLSKDALKLFGGGVEKAEAEWSLLYRGGQMPFCIEAAQLALFQSGVGFLSICAMPTTPSVNDWLDFLHYFRYMRRDHLATIKAHRKVQSSRLKVQSGGLVEPGTLNLELEAEQAAEDPVLFFPEAAGGLAKHPQGGGLIEDLVRALLETALPNPPHPPQDALIPHSTLQTPHSTEWWRDVFVRGQLLPFATLYVDGIPEEETPLLLYRVRNFFWSRQGSNPAPEDLRPDHESLLPYAGRAWFVFSLDGGAFVACDAPSGDDSSGKFFRETMPAHLDGHYFLLFLLALHQRFVLMKLSRDVARDWPLEDPDGGELSAAQRKRDLERAEIFERIRRALFSFTARGYFAQAMQQEHHHRCYRKWQETFEVGRLYQEVGNEVREMHAWLQARQAVHLQRLAEEQRRHAEEQRQQQQREADAQREQAAHLEGTLSRIAWLLGIPVVALTFLQAISVQPFWLTLTVSLGSILLGIILFFTSPLIIKWLRRLIVWVRG